MPSLYTAILKPGDKGLAWNSSSTGSHLFLKHASLQKATGLSPVSLTVQKASGGSEEVTIGVLGLEGVAGFQVDLAIQENVTFRARGASDIHLVGLLEDGKNQGGQVKRTKQSPLKEKPNPVPNGAQEKSPSMKDLPVSNVKNAKPVTTPVPQGVADKPLPVEGEAQQSTGKRKRKRKQRRKSGEAVVGDPQPGDEQVENQKQDVNQEQPVTPLSAISSASLDPVTPTPSPMSGGAPKKKDTRRFKNGFVIHNKSYGKPDGKVALKGKKVSVSYEGKLAESGQVFDKTTGKKHFEFVLGAGQVIKGWDKGMEQMRVGDIRQLTIPPSMAYGEQGVPPKIPCNSTLVFDVTLHDVK